MTTKKNLLSCLVITSALVALLSGCAAPNEHGKSKLLDIEQIKSAFTSKHKLHVESTDFVHGGTLGEQQKLFDKERGCYGGNISPQLSWGGAPIGTKSFALTVFEPDASTGVGWWHWMVINIPASATQLKKGAGNVSGKFLPKGAMQLKNDFNVADYSGACPPKGHKHHYNFTVWALSVDKLEKVGTNWSPGSALSEIQKHSLGSGTITAHTVGQ